jgi:hypothetical protein
MFGFLIGFMVAWLNEVVIDIKKQFKAIYQK